MTTPDYFQAALTSQELYIVSTLNSPQKIQAYLDAIPYSTEPIYRCPLQVLRDQVGHCFDGALFAAALLRRLGYPPLILDMIPNNRDDDHLLALFKQDGHWGAIAKSNFVGLRFREPIYRNLRELVLSFFEQYYNLEGEKTLRGYTRPLDLAAFDNRRWMTSAEPLERIAQRLDEIRRFSLLTTKMIENLSAVDQRSFQAGLKEADEAGLFKP